MRPSGPGAGGFTLVELLLALAVFAVLLLLLVGGFSGAARTLDALREREASLRQCAAALDRIASDLSGAVDTPRIATIRLESRQSTFAGFPAASVQFAAFTLPDNSLARPSTDLCKLKYSARLADGGERLDLFRERSDLPLVESRLPSVERKVARGIRGFEVSLHDGKEWRTEWPPPGASGGLLPSMASVTVTDGEGRRFRRLLSLPLAGSEEELLRSGRRSGTSP